MTAPPQAPSIALEMHICDQRRGYVVRFDGPNAEDMALAFLAARQEGGDRYAGAYGNHAWFEIEEEPLDYDAFPRLYALLYPTCPHGMQLSNCYGPQHYYFDEEEQSMGHRNGW